MNTKLYDEKPRNLQRMPKKPGRDILSYANGYQKEFHSECKLPMTRFSS